MTLKVYNKDTLPSKAYKNTCLKILLTTKNKLGLKKLNELYINMTFNPNVYCTQFLQEYKMNIISTWLYTH